MIKGQPPHSNVHPMRLIFLIPKDPPPLIDPADRACSDAYKEFVALCLAKDPAERPTARDLLKHRLFKKVRKTAALADLIERKAQWLMEHGDDDDASQDDDDDGDGDGDAKEDAWDFGTIKPVPAGTGAGAGAGAGAAPGTKAKRQTRAISAADLKLALNPGQPAPGTCAGTGTGTGSEVGGGPGPGPGGAGDKAKAEAPGDTVLQDAVVPSLCKVCGVGAGPGLDMCVG